MYRGRIISTVTGCQQTMKQYLNEQQVSDITGFKLPTLRNHRHFRKGIPYIKAGRSVKYDPADVESYMQKHRIDPEAVAD